MFVTLYSLPVFVLATIVLFVAVQHSMLWWRDRGQTANLYFALSSLFIGGYDLASFGLYNCSNVVDGARMQILSCISIAMFAVSFMAFFFAYIKKPFNKHFWILFGVITAIGLLMAICPPSWVSDPAFPMIKSFHFFGLDVVYREGKSGPMMIFLITALLAELIYMTITGFRKYSRIRSSDGLAMLAVLIAFLGGGVNDVFINLGLYQSVYLLEYSYMVLIVYMAHRLSVSVTDTVVSRRHMDDMRNIYDELVEARNAAEESDRAKGLFLASVSHEFRTPLNGILGMAGLLQLTKLSQEQREYVWTIHSSGTHLLEIFNDIMDLSRLEQGKIAVEISSCDIRRLVEDGTQLFASQATSKNIVIVCDIDPRIPERVRTDAVHFRQILINLVSNAVKFTDRGEVVVKLHCDEASIDAGGRIMYRLVVRDTGIGISALKLSRLFQSFSQADESVGRRYGGTGLGLAISAGLARLVGGEISVKSEPGIGSEFTCLIPMESGDLLDLPPAPENEEGGVSALVIDISESSRTALALLLNFWEMKTSVATGIEEAIAISSETRFDILLIDSSLISDDVKLLDKVTRFGAVPTVLLLRSPENVEAVINRCRGAGVRAYVLSPVKRNDLRTAIETAVAGIGEFASETPESLPIASHTEPSGRSPIPEKPAARILVAEDNKPNRYFMTELLSKLGYHSYEAEDGGEVLDILSRETVDMVLMDVQMPEMDGVTATRIIREREKENGHPRIPIIALTAFAVSGDRERFIESGMDDYLPKPFTIDELSRMLSRYVPKN